MQSATTETIHEEGLAFDQGSEMHDPNLYRAARVATKRDGLGSIDDAAIEEYRQTGYLAIENAFSPEEVKAALDGLVGLIMGQKPDFKGIWFESKAREILPSLNAAQRQDAVRKLGFFVDHDAGLRAMATHPGLMAVISRLIGGTPTLFQDMALIKPPRLGREKPWHQDHAYFAYPLGTPIVGVWIALDEATVGNGCMHLLEGGHRLGPKIHFKRRDWQICDNEMMGCEAVAVPLKPGGLLLFDGLLPHGTPHNNSGERRRAIQYHYAPDTATKVEDDYRLGVFGSEGKGVTC
ncbi:MAG: phytanoyl-CoA dioxygenase family protein [Opitutaceae bacterium]